MRIAITCPIYINTIGTRNYVDQMTRSLCSEHEWIFIPLINRYTLERKSWEFTQQPSEVIELEGDQPQSVAKGWNKGISKGFEKECDYVLVVNQDIIVAQKAIDNLVTFAEANKETNNILFTMREHQPLETLNVQTGGADGIGPHFSAFMVGRNFQEIFGKFDENFVAGYFEDNESHARLTRLNKHALSYRDSRFFHHGSIVLKTDPDFQNGHSTRFNKNHDYFVQKWGSEIVNSEEEMRRLYYNTPYNIPELKATDVIPDYWQFLTNQGVQNIKQVPKEKVLSYLRERSVIS